MINENSISMGKYIGKICLIKYIKIYKNKKGNKRKQGKWKKKNAINKMRQTVKRKLNLKTKTNLVLIKHNMIFFFKQESRPENSYFIFKLQLPLFSDREEDTAGSQDVKL